MPVSSGRAGGTDQFAGAAVDGNGAVRDQVDVLVVIEFLRPEHQGVRAASAFQIGFRERRPLIGQMRFVIDQTDGSAVSRLTQRHRELKARVAGANDQNWPFFHLVNPIGSKLFDRLPCYLQLATFCRRRVRSATPFARLGPGLSPHSDFRRRYAPAFSDLPWRFENIVALERGTLFGYQKRGPTDPERCQMLAPALASPETVGMSKAAFDRIEDHLKRRYLDAGRFPGTQLVVYRRGNIVHRAVQGLADLKRNVPMKDDTIFRIYSMTKPITSVAFMMLVEQGLAALDEPVHKYIPEWKNLGVYQAGTAPAFMTRPPTRPMQIVDLLRHTSGLTYGFQQRSNVDAAYRDKQIGTIEMAGTLDSMIADLADIPLEFSPGEAWNYSVSTDVIGYLIGKSAACRSSNS